MSEPLSNLFAEILDLRDELGSPIRHLLRPPLPSERVVTVFQSGGIQPPQVLLDLYAITDGLQLAARFIGGMRLLPLQEAITAFKRWKPILLEHGHPPLFPITEDEFGVAYGVLLRDSLADPPVLSLPLQCGTDQFYDSVTVASHSLERKALECCFVCSTRSR